MRILCGPLRNRVRGHWCLAENVRKTVHFHNFTVDSIACARMACLESILKLRP